MRALLLVSHFCAVGHPYWFFETYSLYSRYLRPFLSFITEIWLYFQTRRLQCSWPALSAKFKPSKNNNVSSSFCGVSVPRMLCFHIYSSCSSEMTSALFLSIPRPRPDNSFIFESSTFLNPWNVSSSKKTHKSSHLSHMVLDTTNKFIYCIWHVIFTFLISYFRNKISQCFVQLLI